MPDDEIPDYRPSPMDAANLLRLINQEALVALAGELLTLDGASYHDHDRIVETVCLVREALAVLDASIGLTGEPAGSKLGMEDYRRIKGLAAKK